MRKITTEEYKQVVLEILLRIDEICKNNGLRYMISYGTLLGAVRHQGFIPWDDDIDIGLTRDEYEKLIKILHHSNNEYVLQNESNEKNYFVMFSKLRKNGTTFIDEDTKGLFDNNGIFIDLFPFDKVKDIDSVGFRVRYRIIKLISHTLRMKYSVANHRNKTFREKIDIILSSVFIRIVKKERLMVIQKKLMIWDNNTSDEKTKYYMVYMGPYKLKNSYIKSKWINNYGKCCFEGKEYQCLGDMNSYLTQSYGSNYMELPPVEKRETHRPIVLKFRNE